jgi:AraC-like DNA-binding protein
MPSWLANLHNGYAIHNVVVHRPELPFFVIQWDGGTELHWIDLGDPRIRIRPFHFEIFFGKESARDAYYLNALCEAAATDGLVTRELFGFRDLFCRFPGEHGQTTFLYAGQFLCEPPTWDSLGDSWRAITGQEPASANPDFAHFARTALKLPVLGPDLLEAMSKFTVLYAAHLAGGEPDIGERVDRVNRDYFSALWPTNHWVQSVIQPDKFLLPPWYFEGKLVDWVKEAIGISRLPTTAMTLMPLDSRASKLDWVQTMIRNAQLQRECIAFARELPETSACPLQDYGISIVTSCDPKKSASRQRLELKDRAEAFRDFVRKRFNVHSVVGIGPTLSRGAPLYESHREAVLTLHMCVQLKKSVMFFNDHEGSRQFRYSELQEAANHLTEVLDRDNSTELHLASGVYVQLVLRYSNERVEVARGQFLAMLFQLIAVVQRRNPMREQVRDTFVSNLTLGLEEARSLNDVIEEFNEALNRLSVVASRAWQGSNVVLLEATLQYLRENFHEQLPLPKVARKAGFSVPAFTRIFKQATGTTFVSYLRNVRIDHAKKLVATTPLSLEQVAHSCGFNSQHHLIRSFKKVTDMTPGAYRREQRLLEDIAE